MSEALSGFSSDSRIGAQCGDDHASTGQRKLKNVAALILANHARGLVLTNRHEPSRGAVGHFQLGLAPEGTGVSLTTRPWPFQDRCVGTSKIWGLPRN